MMKDRIIIMHIYGEGGVEAGFNCICWCVKLNWIEHKNEKGKKKKRDLVSSVVREIICIVVKVISKLFPLIHESKFRDETERRLAKGWRLSASSSGFISSSSGSSS